MAKQKVAPHVEVEKHGRGYRMTIFDGTALVCGMAYFKRDGTLSEDWWLNAKGRGPAKAED